MGKLYDLKKPGDLIFLYKCAKGAGYEALAQRALETMPGEIREEILHTVEEEDVENVWRLPARNQTDRRFIAWAKAVRESSQEQLAAGMKSAFAAWKTGSGCSSYNYTATISYLKKYPLWGSLDPEKGDYDTFARRAHMMKAHLENLVWLYGRLEDWRSRNTLLAVLMNWTYLDTHMLKKTVENGSQYFDYDLIPEGKEEVFVDLGAYVGDSVSAFVHAYGKDYRRIYAYEPEPQNAAVMERNLARFRDIEIRRKGAGRQKEQRRFLQEADPSSGRFEEGKADGTASGTEDVLELVSLDEDITEPVTWIKLDVEGGEYDALLGASGHIRREKPKLSVAVYHGYDDLWRLPRLIGEMNPDYRFYLRNYGGDLLPTEIVLTALP